MSDEYPIEGRLYKHHKGGVYQVLHLAREEGSDRPVVVYKGITKDSPVYTRPLDEFMSPVDIEQPAPASRIRRFLLLEDGLQPFNRLYDEDCRHNEVPYPQKVEVRKAAHWYRIAALTEKDARHEVGDVLLVSYGYVTNIRCGWTWDPLPGEVRGSGTSVYSQMAWPENQTVCMRHLLVKRIHDPNDL